MTTPYERHLEREVARLNDVRERSYWQAQRDEEANEAARLRRELGALEDILRESQDRVERLRAELSTTQSCWHSAELEAVLAAARRAVDLNAICNCIEEYVCSMCELDEAVRAADATPPTERAAIDPITCPHKSRARVGHYEDEHWACNDCGYDNADDPVALSGREQPWGGGFCDIGE